MRVYGLNWALALIFAPGVGLKLLALNPTLLWAGCGVLTVLGALIISREVRTNKPVP